MASEAEAKLDQFLQWLQANKVELRGCSIKYSDPEKGFGIYRTADAPEDGVLVVVPLELAITPMRVLQDPVIGLECRKLFEDGVVDDRFLIILFLTVERLLKNSSWMPYLDMLPESFGNPLWFTDDEIEELKGTTLYRASELQKKKLKDIFDSKVKDLVKKLLLLHGNTDSEVFFQDFLWANAVFWTRALNIPLPHSYVFPTIEESETCIPIDTLSETSVDNACGRTSNSINNLKVNEVDLVGNRFDNAIGPEQEETVWVEGLVPGIDFCNHSLRPGATWEVDRKGSITGIPVAMYLLSAEQTPVPNQELTISYGDKGNEELLYLYGFVMDNNPDDYLMVHYPVESLQSAPCSDAKSQLLQAQNAEMRCLLPRHLLAHGFFPVGSSPKDCNNNVKAAKVCNYSWSGCRRIPSYLSELIFPEDFLAALRTISMNDEQIYQVSSMLEELVGSEEKQPSETEVRTAVWEACGDAGAFQLLVDLLQMKMMELEEGSGTEDSDSQLLENAHIETTRQSTRYNGDLNGSIKKKYITRNTWSAIVYRRGQKQLTRLFLREAEHALELSITEQGG
uniref:SET domain-containing protein n=2 Tax=Kalanchoe fedtschenkoi TaxID=63787 RepID=A0A7N0T2I1_KALFE